MQKITKNDLIYRKEDIFLTNIECVSIKILEMHKVLDEDCMEFIESNWKEINKNNVYTNEDLLDVNLIYINGGDIVLECDKTNYKYHKITQLPKYFKYIQNDNYFSNHLISGAIIITSDGKFLFGKHNKYVKLIGGMFDFNQDSTIFDCIKREMKEEIGNLSINKIKAKYLLFNKKYHYTAIVFNINISLSEADVLGIFIPNDEIHNLLFLNDLKEINGFELSPLLELLLKKIDK